MSHWRTISLFVACATMFTSVAIGQDIGKGKQNKTSGSTTGSTRGGGQTTPPRSTPPPVNRGEQSRSTPPQRVEPPKSRGGQSDPPVRNTEPPKSRGGEGSGQTRGNTPPAKVGGGQSDPPTRTTEPPKSRGGESSGQTRGSLPPTKVGGGQLGPPTGGSGDQNKARGGAVGDPRGGFSGYDDPSRVKPTLDISKSGPRRGTGSNAYGTNSNHNQSNRTEGTHTRVGGIDIYSGPLEHQVRREDRIRIITNGRRGYVHYNPSWCDDWFYSPWYVFDPFRSHCVVSPWYWYPHLPGYLSLSRVVYVQVPVIVFGSSYDWNPPSRGWNNTRYTELDYTVDDLVRGFERADMRLIGRLAPREGRVHYYFDGQYEYSLHAEDFYDMMSDLVEGTQTLNYRVLDVRRNRGDAVVFAEHVFLDSWGARRSNYHMIRLEERDRGRYEIAEFGTSANRWKL